MINLTLIQELADQVVGSLAEIQLQPGLPPGVNAVLGRCIATIKSISEDITNDNEAQGLRRTERSTLKS